MSATAAERPLCLCSFPLLPVDGKLRCAACASVYFSAPPADRSLFFIPEESKAGDILVDRVSGRRFRVEAVDGLARRVVELNGSPAAEPLTPVDALRGEVERLRGEVRAAQGEARDNATAIAKLTRRVEKPEGGRGDA